MSVIQLSAASDLGLCVASPSKCSSCSEPHRSGSPEMASSRSSRHIDERCSCDTAPWRLCSSAHPAWAHTMHVNKTHKNTRSESYYLQNKEMTNSQLEMMCFWQKWVVTFYCSQKLDSNVFPARKHNTGLFWVCQYYIYVLKHFLYILLQISVFI